MTTHETTLYRDLIKDQLREALLIYPCDYRDKIKAAVLPGGVRGKRIVGLNGSTMIRLHLCGKSIMLGYLYGAEEDTAEKALRYSDMCLLYFWKYRMRGHTEEPPSYAYNINRAQAKDDLRQEKNLMRIITQAEACLLHSNQLLPVDEMARRRGVETTTRQQNLNGYKSFRDDITTRVAALETENKVIADALKKLLENQTKLM